MKIVKLEKMWNGWMNVSPVNMPLNKENANLIDAINDKILMLDEAAARKLIASKYPSVKIEEN